MFNKRVAIETIIWVGRSAKVNIKRWEEMMEEKGKKEGGEKEKEAWSLLPFLPSALAIPWEVSPALGPWGSPCLLYISCLLICLPHETGPLWRQKSRSAPFTIYLQLPTQCLALTRYRRKETKEKGVWQRERVSEGTRWKSCCFILISLTVSVVSPVEQRQ